MHGQDTKASCMVVGTRLTLEGSHSFNIKAGNVSIKHVSNQELFVIKIDENLNLRTHIESLCKTIASKISLL